MKFVKYVFFTFWILFFGYGISLNYSHYSLYDILALFIIFLLPFFIYYLCKKSIKNKNMQQEKNSIKTYDTLSNSKNISESTKKIEQSIKKSTENNSEYKNNKECLNNFIQDIENQFDSQYLDSILDDGKTIREHMINDYKKQSYNSSEQAKKDFPKEINKQYNYIVEHMDNRSSKYIDMTNEEEIIIKTFLEKVSYVRKKYSVNIERSSNGMIRINYNGYPTGQFNLRNNSNYVRFLRGMQINDKHNATYDEILKAIDSWVRYCKYQLAETRF